MSLTSRATRRLAAAGATTIVAFGAATGSALADTSTTLNYQCTMPLIGAQPLTADVTTNIPQTFAANTPTPAYSINVTAHALGDTYNGLNLIGASSISGTATAAVSVKQPSGATTALTAPVTVANTPVPATDPGAAGVTFLASGSAPSVTFDGPGTASVSVDGIALSLLAKDSSGAVVGGLGSATDSDANADTFDVPCTGASTKLTDVTVTP